MDSTDTVPASPVGEVASEQALSSLLRRGPLRSPNLAHPDSGTLPHCTGVCLSAKDGTILAGLCRCFRWQQPLPAFPRAAGRTIRFWTLR
jgi:hypothetical protein